jgi:hypothetical protein
MNESFDYDDEQDDGLAITAVCVLSVVCLVLAGLGWLAWMVFL